jgi:RNA polymerase sigma factor (sigma-70 family)
MLFTFLEIKKLENVSVCTIKALERAGITDVEEVLSLSPYKLYNIRGIGDKGYLELVDALEKLNINVDRFRYFLTASKRPFKSKNSNLYPFNLINDISEVTFSHLTDDYESALNYIISTLTLEEKKIVDLRYKNYHTVNECAKILGVSIGTVSKLQKRTIEKLRDTARSKYLFINSKFSISNAVEGTYIISLGLERKLEKQLTDLGYETVYDIINSLNTIKKKLTITYYNKLLKALDRYGISISN